MRPTSLIPIACVFAALLGFGCSRMPGPPEDSSELMRPQDEVSFEHLYSQNCSACHGQGGRNGPALDLANPVYQAIVDDAALKRWITGGMPGTQMPAFGESAGGFLTDRQVDALVAGIRKNWAQGSVPPAQNAPRYATALNGNAMRGEQVYETDCLSCHRQTKQQVTNTSYLALVSDQALRTIIIAGRPDLGHPDWRHNPAGNPLSDQDVTDLVTYLGTLRVSTPGQPYPERP